MLHHILHPTREEAEASGAYYNVRVRADLGSGSGSREIKRILGQGREVRKSNKATPHQVPHLTREEAEAIFAALDTNHDASISQVRVY